MPHVPAWPFFLALLFAPPVSAVPAGSPSPDAPAVYPTPRITEFFPLPAGSPPIVALVTPWPPGSVTDRIGFAAVCGASELVVDFGLFPSDLRPVQASVRGLRGVVRLSPVRSHQGPRSGFHSERITDLELLRTFAEYAFDQGALVSNGYTSFYNDVPQALLDARRAAFHECLGIPPP